MQETKYVFLCGCLAMLLFGVALITLGSSAVALQNKFQLDPTSFGALFSILPIGILLGSLLFGPFADRYGYKIILVVSCLCMFAGFQGIAFASSFNLLKVCIFIFGFGGGVLNGASNAAVADISKDNKGADLSLLGVFFAIGALGMPFVLGALEKLFSFEVVLSTISYLSILAAIVFLLTRFPKPKQEQGIPLLRGVQLLKDPVLLLIGFFLFCQSSFEAVVNNWTTTYLISKLSVPSDKALYALSLYVAGMGVMRLLIGSLLRNVTPKTILVISFSFLFAGSLTLQLSMSYFLSTTGLILLGAGLAGGFPIMLGFVSNLYTALSATAFSLVLAIALFGNMTLNFLMGIIVETYGIRHLTSMSFVLLGVMILLTFPILKKINTILIKNNYAGKTMA